MSDLETKAKYAIGTWTLRGLNRSLRTLGRTFFGPIPTPREAQRVVIHLIGNIGDVVVAVPALMALRTQFPSARLTLLTSPGARGAPGAKSLLSGVPYLDDVEVYYQDDIDTPAKQLALARRIRAYRADLMVFLPSSVVTVKTVYRNFAFAVVCRPGAVFNYQLPSPPIFRLAFASVARTVPQEVDRHLTALRPLGIDAQPHFMLANPSEADEEVIAEAVAATVAGKPIVAVSPGGKQSGHLWPIERFVEVARRLDEADICLWLVGGPGDKELAATILKAVPSALDLTGALSIAGTARLLSHANCLLTNDTGPMHLAAAVGTPVAAIFSSQNYAGRWYPYGSGHVVFRAEEVCPYCLFNDTRTQHCVGRIHVDEVAEACLRMVAGKIGEHA